LDWLESLDLDLALHNCRNDILGDWYRDPWGWPELDWAVHKRPEIIVARLNSSGARRAARLDVAKENFGIRPAVVLDPIDRISYQALTDRLSNRLIGSMPEWVYGWRLPLNSEKSGAYARNDHQWLNFVGRLSHASNSYPYLLKTDIVSFFSSVPIQSLNDRLFEVAGHSAVTERLASMLLSWDRTPDRRGLPQRSAASAVLANMYLSPIDELISNYVTSLDRTTTGVAFRWMDDIWYFAESESHLRGMQLELQRALRTIGLELNIAKTAVFDERETRHEVEKLDFTGLDYLLGLEPSSPQALTEFDALVDELSAFPEQANRTTIRFVTTRMRQHHLYKKVRRLVDKTPHMPQGADSLARLFRDSGVSRDLVSWYLDYATGPWGKIDWTVAQLGTMFPGNSFISLDLEEFFTTLLMRTRSLALVALGAHRLAASGLDTVRYTLREAATLSDNPMHRRVLALAALQAGEPRLVVRRILSEFEENAVTLEMLEDRGFRAARPSADFLGRRGKSR
jgi:hypothetical protein